jgi:hypothetical protein
VEIRKLEFNRLYNTGRKGKIHVYAKPRWRISFEISESALLQLIKRTQDLRDSKRYSNLEVVHSPDAWALGRELIRLLFKGGYGKYLTKFIKWRRKKDKEGPEVEEVLGPGDDAYMTVKGIVPNPPEEGPVLKLGTVAAVSKDLDVAVIMAKHNEPFEIIL